jgi:predicted Zn-dependent protease
VSRIGQAHRPASIENDVLDAVVQILLLSLVVRHQLPRVILRLALVAMVVVVGFGCASPRQARFQEAIRQAAGAPASHAQGRVPAIFRDLGQAAGLDPRRIYVALRDEPGLNAAALGNHHFYVTRGAAQANDPCFLIGLIAHELAHDILKHPESLAQTSDAVGMAGIILGTVAGVFVPGAGYLVQGATEIGMRAYSRGQESEADALAAKLLREAGKPPWALRYTLEYLQAVAGDQKGVSWLSTHPLLPERIASQPPVVAEEATGVCPGLPSLKPSPAR